MPKGAAPAGTPRTVIREYRSFAHGTIQTAPIEAAKRRRFASRYRTIRWVLSVMGVVLAAAAGVTALPADVAAWVTPSLAFVAAAVSGLTTALHPSKRAADHCMAAADWDVLAADCRIFSAMVPTLGGEEAETEFKSLEARYRTLRGSSETDE